VAGIVPPGAWGPLLALRETGADEVGLAAADADGAVVVLPAGAQDTQSSATAIRVRGFFTFSPLGWAGTGKLRGQSW
jgi:hypothetical protein